MQETPYNDSATDPEFPGPDAPPLEDEARCICGELEGDHQAVTGFCPASGCLHFVAEDFHEEATAPDLVVEYDPEFEPRRAG